MSRTIVRSAAAAQLFFLLSLPFIGNLIQYLHPLALIVVWACITSFTITAGLLIRGEKLPLNKYLVLLSFALYSASLLVLLFFRPGDNANANYNLDPFSTIEFYLAGRVDSLVAFYNLAANIILFIPYGLFLILLMKKKSIFTLLVIPVVSISAIEISQFLSRRGSLDIDDLILNLLGVFLGYAFSPLLQRVYVIKESL
ncbi:VanZ family protein [Bacillus sp. AG4(2022)]|uniref:VanZ family protein n=1 Tax=Bacillus sp. AG4(2022) TaxID=2962594 RepID=UPI0028815B68|nr:VanZ family protein [Bacillus sp. AG4(2022)]MDT0163344.1 VanZ family protein [Bacillus sp. AG4(2022)]